MSLVHVLVADHLELGVRFCLNLAVTLAITLGIYYRRYGDKELVVSATLFNVFIFSVLSVLSGIEFSVSAGFGLFAILALFTLRSEQISKIEITYFFGAVSVAVIFALDGVSLTTATVTALIVLISVFLLDHPKVLPPVSTLRITLDKIDAHVLSDPQRMCRDLSERLSVPVLSYQIKTLDFINDLAILHVNYKSN